MLCDLPYDIIYIIMDSIKVTTIYSICRTINTEFRSILRYGKVFKNNKLVIKMGFKNGYRHGKYFTYSGDDLLSIKHYIYGKLYGPCYYYWDKQIIVLICYKANVRHGLRFELYNNGITHYTENYFYGKLHGRQECFFDNGQRHYTIYYRDGERHGRYLLYYTNGQIKIREMYTNGSLNGYKYSYSDRGILLSKEYFIMGRLHGTKLDYYPDGTIGCVRTYNKGVINGILVRYWENGNIKVLVNYLNGILSGVRIEYDINGNMDDLCNFRYSLRHGNRLIFTEKKLKQLYVYDRGEVIRTYSF